MLLGEIAANAPGSGRSTKTPHGGGSRAVFRGLVNTAVTCRGYSLDLKDPPWASPIAFEPAHGGGGRRWRAPLAGVAGGRRWRASLAGVAGGRRRRSRTKIAVISIKGTKTCHTHKPRKQTAHSERRWLARHTTAEHSREDTAD